jgi:hypothetical protein
MGPLFKDPEILDAKVRVYSVKSGSDMFWALCRTIERPCGLEEIIINDPSLAAGPKGVLLKDQTVKQLLNAIVQQAPAYQWVISQGVINLAPISRDGEGMLSRRPKPVELKKISSIRAAFSIFHGAGLHPTWQAPGRERIKLIDLNFTHGGTVRDALNEIAVADGQVMWLYVPNSDSGSHFLMPNWGPNARMPKSEIDAERDRFREDFQRWSK